MQPSEPVATAYLGLGGNLGDPIDAMGEALRHFDERPDCRVTAVSRLYRTPPWGKADQPWFVNAAAAIDTALAPHALLDLCLEIERSLKRIRGERWGPRTIDIDILDIGGLTLAVERLELPHPRMLDRGFVLMPLADIAPQLEIAGQTVSAWLDKADTTGIEIAGPDRQWWRIS